MTGEDPFGRNCAVEVLSIIDALSGDPAPARRLAEAELARSKQQKVRLGFGALMHALGVVALALDDLPAARWWGDALYEQEKAGAAYLAWHAQEVLMHAALAAGESCVAHEHSKLLAEHAQQLGNRRGLAIAQRGMARVLMMGDDDTGAERLAHSALGGLPRQRLAAGGGRHPRGDRGDRRPDLACRAGCPAVRRCGGSAGGAGRRAGTR